MNGMRNDEKAELLGQYRESAWLAPYGVLGSLTELAQRGAPVRLRGRTD